VCACVCVWGGGTSLPHFLVNICQPSSSKLSLSFPDIYWEGLDLFKLYIKTTLAECKNGL
jgi:hypothetical protein